MPVFPYSKNKIAKDIRDALIASGLPVPEDADQDQDSEIVATKYWEDYTPDELRQLPIAELNRLATDVEQRALNTDKNIDPTPPIEDPVIQWSRMSDDDKHALSTSELVELQEAILQQTGTPPDRDPLDPEAFDTMRGVHNIKGTLWGAVESGSVSLGADWLEETAKKYKEENERQARGYPRRFDSFEKDVKNWDDFGAYIYENSFELLPNLVISSAAALGGAASLGSAGLSEIGKRVVKKYVFDPKKQKELLKAFDGVKNQKDFRTVARKFDKNTAKKLVEEVVKSRKKRAAGAVFGSVYPQLIGEQYDTYRREGLPKEKASALSFATGIPAALLDTAGFGVGVLQLSKVANVSPKNIIEFLGKVGVLVGIPSVIEGITEMGQTLIPFLTIKYAHDSNYDPFKEENVAELKESFMRASTGTGGHVGSVVVPYSTAQLAKNKLADKIKKYGGGIYKSIRSKYKKWADVDVHKEHSDMESAAERIRTGLTTGNSEQELEQFETDLATFVSQAKKIFSGSPEEFTIIQELIQKKLGAFEKSLEGDIDPETKRKVLNDLASTVLGMQEQINGLYKETFGPADLRGLEKVLGIDAKELTAMSNEDFATNTESLKNWVAEQQADGVEVSESEYADLQKQLLKAYTNREINPFATSEAVSKVVDIFARLAVAYTLVPSMTDMDAVLRETANFTEKVKQTKGELGERLAAVLEDEHLTYPELKNILLNAGKQFTEEQVIKLENRKQARIDLARKVNHHNLIAPFLAVLNNDSFKGNIYARYKEIIDAEEGSLTNTTLRKWKQKADLQEGRTELNSKEQRQVAEVIVNVPNWADTLAGIGMTDGATIISVGRPTYVGQNPVNSESPGLPLTEEEAEARIEQLKLYNNNKEEGDLNFSIAPVNEVGEGVINEVDTVRLAELEERYAGKEDLNLDEDEKYHTEVQELNTLRKQKEINDTYGSGEYFYIKVENLNQEQSDTRPDVSEPDSKQISLVDPVTMVANAIKSGWAKFAENKFDRSIVGIPALESEESVPLNVSAAGLRPENIQNLFDQKLLTAEDSSTVRAEVDPEHGYVPIDLIEITKLGLASISSRNYARSRFTAKEIYDAFLEGIVQLTLYRPDAARDLLSGIDYKIIWEYGAGLHPSTYGSAKKAAYKDTSPSKKYAKELQGKSREELETIVQNRGHGDSVYYQDAIIELIARLEKHKQEYHKLFEAQGWDIEEPKEIYTERDLLQRFNPDEEDLSPGNQNLKTSYTEDDKEFSIYDYNKTIDRIYGLEDRGNLDPSIFDEYTVAEGTTVTDLYKALISVPPENWVNVISEKPAERLLDKKQYKRLRNYIEQKLEAAGLDPKNPSSLAGKTVYEVLDILDIGMPLPESVKGKWPNIFESGAKLKTWNEFFNKYGSTAWFRDAAIEHEIDVEKIIHRNHIASWLLTDSEAHASGAAENLDPTVTWRINGSLAVNRQNVPTRKGVPDKVLVEERANFEKIAIALKWNKAVAGADYVPDIERVEQEVAKIRTGELDADAAVEAQMKELNMSLEELETEDIPFKEHPFYEVAVAINSLLDEIQDLTPSGSEQIIKSKYFLANNLLATYASLRLYTRPGLDENFYVSTQEEADAVGYKGSLDFTSGRYRYIAKSRDSDLRGTVYDQSFVGKILGVVESMMWFDYNNPTYMLNKHIQNQLDIAENDKTKRDGIVEYVRGQLEKQGRTLEPDLNIPQLRDLAPLPLNKQHPTYSKLREIRDSLSTLQRNWDSSKRDKNTRIIKDSIQSIKDFRDSLGHSAIQVAQSRYDLIAREIRDLIDGISEFRPLTEIENDLAEIEKRLAEPELESELRESLEERKIILAKDRTEIEDSQYAIDYLQPKLDLNLKQLRQLRNAINIADNNKRFARDKNSNVIDLFQNTEYGDDNIHNLGFVDSEMNAAQTSLEYSNGKDSWAATKKLRNYTGRTKRKVRSKFKGPFIHQLTSSDFNEKLVIMLAQLQKVFRSKTPILLVDDNGLRDILDRSRPKLEYTSHEIRLRNYTPPSLRALQEELEATTDKDTRVSIQREIDEHNTSIARRKLDQKVESRSGRVNDIYNNDIIKAMEAKLGDPDVVGNIFFPGDHVVIHIRSIDHGVKNSGVTYATQLRAIAHEYGHLIQHKHYHSATKEVKEALDEAHKESKIANFDEWFANQTALWATTGEGVLGAHVSALLKDIDQVDVESELLVAADGLPSGYDPNRFKQEQRDSAIEHNLSIQEFFTELIKDLRSVFNWFRDKYKFELAPSFSAYMSTLTQGKEFNPEVKQETEPEVEAEAEVEANIKSERIKDYINPNYRDELLVHLRSFAKRGFHPLLSAEKQLRQLGLDELADLLGLRPQTVGNWSKGLPWMPGVQNSTRRWGQVFQDLLPKDSSKHNDFFERYYDKDNKDPDVIKFRGKYREFLTYLKKHIHDKFEAVGAHSLRTYNIERIENELGEDGKSSTFVKFIVAYAKQNNIQGLDHIVIAKLARDTILSDSMSEISDSFLKFPSTITVKSPAPNIQELLSAIPDHVLAEHGWLEKNKTFAFFTAIRRGIRKAEISRVFGGYNETQKGDRGWWDPALGIKAHLNNIKNKRDKARAKVILQGIFGQRGVNIDPQLRKIQDGLMAYQNWRVLLFSTLASTPEFAGPILRSKDMDGAWASLSRIRDTVKNKKELLERYKAMGFMEETLTNYMLMQTYGLSTTPSMSYSANQMLFKFNGQKFFMDTLRFLSASVAEDFIIRHATKPNEHSKRYLDELNLTEDVVKQWIEEGKPIWHRNDNAVVGDQSSNISDLAERIQNGIGIFVDQSTVHVNNLQKPVFMSDPRFALLTHLKPFFYAHTHTILEGIWNNMRYHKDNRPLVPLLIAGLTILPLAAVGLELRELIQYGGQRDPTAGMSYGNYILKLLQVSGMYGVMELGFSMVDTIEGNPWQRNMILGPTVGQGLNILEGKESLLHATPIFSQIPIARQAVSQ